MSGNVPLNLKTITEDSLNTFNLQTGECIDCRDWTDGVHCEICLDGYYGDPTLEVNIPCRECPCPNSKASGHSFADICYLDTTNNEPVCECEEGYTGAMREYSQRQGS